MMTEQLTTAQQIVEDLAKRSPVIWTEGLDDDDVRLCPLCMKQETFWARAFEAKDHYKTCPYRRAVEYMESLKAGER